MEKKIQSTTIDEDVDETINEVFLAVVRALIGHSYSEELIKEYLNYDSANY